MPQPDTFVKVLGQRRVLDANRGHDPFAAGKRGSCPRVAHSLPAYLIRIVSPNSMYLRVPEFDVLIPRGHVLFGRYVYLFIFACADNLNTFRSPNTVKRKRFCEFTDSW